MMRRYRYASSVQSFGPGGISPAIKMIIWANVGVFVMQRLAPGLVIFFGLTPAAVFERFWLWQPVTYLFLHGGFSHILFNMLALWMFGVELERLWGTEAFIKYYFVTGLGAAATVLIWALLPMPGADQMYAIPTIGASGAIYGVLLAFALYYPDRPIYMYFLFPVPAKYFVMIIGAFVFMSSVSGAGGGVSHSAHLGGLVAGYLYLKGGTGGLIGELKYQYIKWKMNRLRRRFGVHPGGRRDDWNDRIH
ncbi:MAG: rhomboid family intramembrane serine protease [Vicinamibacterales bacterium]|jgi:membrane associated rhomboid family serine protease|nr:rhomboid family intramembrane serine protease [Acidobacteriota bacterium]MDP6372417.1 rhomboid family intramembrane serine protease [Vicinamibacterales bacterium]MDP6608960.1 rhomboid family intramembrane serine protease [Vicinamibacterales bacterium]HAK54312.1 DUF1751 domain-containing protein [Acidobacteriota bacterium]|tara:strand:+ start:15365 stop:16111 length:747 start_codon:yes stop_codon:yes gene_type:complete